MYQGSKEIIYYGKHLLQKNVNLFSTEKENNLILLYQRRMPFKPRMIARIHEIWDTNQNYYSLKIRCSKKEKKLVWQYVNELLPLSDFFAGVNCVFFELTT
jgi:ribosomal protein S19